MDTHKHTLVRKDTYTGTRMHPTPLQDACSLLLFEKKLNATVYRVSKSGKSTCLNLFKSVNKEQMCLALASTGMEGKLISDAWMTFLVRT